jgi:predicted ribosomally synthesized peptide with nif11-like leader
MIEKQEEKRMNKNLIEKVKKAASAEEVVALAKEAGIELTEDHALNLFEKLHHADGELADEELANASGGSKCLGGDDCRYFEKKDRNYNGRVDCRECYWYRDGWCIE